MKTTLITLTLLLITTLTTSAQDKILDKYSALGDVSTTSVTQATLQRQFTDGLLDTQHLAEDHLEFLTSDAMQAIAHKIDNIKILSSDKLKAAKQLSQKLPKQLLSNGYTQVTTTRQQNATIRILQSKTNPNSMIFIITDGPKTTVASVKGNFTE